ncbi:SDR family oxidoreductase [Agromyces sp. SYSU T00194]|uniref:SDR family oxidoreductase n=1 Tax=Agromyces chitinivorans TaxID=3158560 RepID=UPI0033928B34
MRRQLLVATAQAFLVTLLWSSSWVLIRIGLEDDLPPLTFAGLRYGLAAVLLLAVALARPRVRAELRALPPRGWLELAALGAVMYAITQGAQFVGLALLPAATLSLFYSLTPVAVAVGALLALGERVGRGGVLGLALTVVGGVTYFVAGGGAGATLAGVLVGLVGLLANAASAVLGRSVNGRAHLSALAVTAPSMAIGAVLLLGTGLASEDVPEIAARAWGIIVVLAVVNTALAWTLWNHTLRTLRAAPSAAINNTMLIQIAVLAAIFLAEPLAPLQWLGLGVVAAGTFLVQFRGLRPGSRSQQPPGYRGPMSDAPAPDARPVTLITGGGRGIGAAIARRLAADGHDLALTYRVRREEVERVAEECRAAGSEVAILHADLGDVAHVHALVPAVLDHFGRITGLVNNAGITGTIGEFLDVDEAEAEVVFDVNVRAPMLLAKDAISVMATDRGGAGGCIVNISSGAATSGAPHTYVPYAMSKAALNALTTGLAKEFAAVGVRVNTVSPGTTHTEIHADAGRPNAPAERAPNIPMRRAGQPHEAAGAVAYLFGADASYTTGADIRVAGGN